jgi:hypothetical protein
MEMESLINFNCIIRKRNLLAHICIWTILAIVLLISTTLFIGSLIGIVYLLFFLSFVLTFQSHYSLWARCIRPYCILLLLYSLSVCLTTYLFQYTAFNSLLKAVLSEQTLNDIGLIVRTSAFDVFFEPFAPLTLTILLVIYLKVFIEDFNRFAYLAEDEEDLSVSTPLTESQVTLHQTINDSTFIMLNTNSITTSPANVHDSAETSTSTNHPETPSNSQQLSQQQQQHNQSTSEQGQQTIDLARRASVSNQTNIHSSRMDLHRVSKRAKIEKFIKATSEICWRLVETHFIKLVALMIFRLPIIDVCLMNFPFLLVVLWLLTYPSMAKCATLVASWLISFIVITRQLSKLATLRTVDFTETCGATAPEPLRGNTYSYLTYLGINHDIGNPLNRVDNHIYVLLLITLYSFTSIRYKRKSSRNYEMSFGIIFVGIGRKEAEAGMWNLIKYFFNFGFYKFGIEITSLALIIAISNRLDVVAAIYGTFLILLGITTSKRTLARIWPILMVIISLLIPIQYLLRIGLPQALCMSYPWEMMEDDFKRWLFLSDYATPQDTSLLLYDFLVFLFVARQAVVFKHMRSTSGSAYVITNRMHHNFAASQFKLRYLPGEDEFVAEDCFRNYTTPSNYMKSIFFISIYWITLAVVLAAGATKISLFSLGYLIGCFIFLWLGNDTYLMPIRRLIFSWNCFIFYAALVIFVKVILQLYSCYKHQYLLNHCYILQLLRIVCYRKIENSAPSNVADPAAICASSLPYDELDILWDGLCLMFLLMQRVVFGSQYFRFLVQEVKAQQILASRGAELIMATKIEEAKAQALYEKEVMRNIRTKMEDLKTDNKETAKGWQRLSLLPHHHQIIRNADKQMFAGCCDEPVSRCRTDDWKFKKAFIPDPLGDELERMSEINGITAVFTRWMKGQPLYGCVGQTNGASSRSSPTRTNSNDEEKTGPEATGACDRDATEPAPTIDPAPIQAQLVATPVVDNIEIQPGDERHALSESFAIIDNDEDSVDSDQKVRGWWDMVNLIVYSCLLSATVELNKLSRSYRYVSRRMAVEKNALKRHFNLNDERFKRDPSWRKWVISTLSDTYTKTNEQYQEGQSNTSLHRIRSALRAITSASGISQDSNTMSGSIDRSPPVGTSYQQQQTGRNEMNDPEYHFLKLNIFTQFCRAVAYVFISNTSLLCQLGIILNQVLTASLLSLPLPLLTFLWGTLSVPRPTKRFWKTVITYTELVIVVKYVFQFPIWDWDVNNINPFYYPNLLGIKNITILYDLFLLLVLFFHRSMLKSLGQWDASGGLEDCLEKPQAAIEPPMSQQPPDPSVDNQQPRQASEARLVKSCDTVTGVPNESNELQIRSRFSSSVEMRRDQAYNEYLEDSYQNRVQEVEINDPQSQAEKGCLVRAYDRVMRSVSQFFQHVLDTPYKVQTDVYTWMFLCDFINFLILIYGFWAFGSGYTNQTVASFLNENRIPFSVLIMLLLQFASIIIDRAFYLQKNIAGKLFFQVVLVIGIHIWLFFALPFTTGHTLTLKEYWPPKAWYIFKCIYFLLSAHQIRSGYPRRVLGNFLTKGFGYANWGAFKVYRAIPLVYDLRLYMDWIWTETTLEFRNWSIMEDIFANLFIRKCELTIEEEYPIPRAKPIRRVSKYLFGGAFILLILAVIWGPLLLFSMGKTVGDSNPPVEMEYELEFVGFQPILRMRATTQQITMINEKQYMMLKAKFVSLSSQSFLSDYKVGDVAATQLDGQSNAVWEISPPSKDLLMNHIKSNQALNMKSSWTIYRIKKEKSQNFDVTIAGSYQKIVSNSSEEFRKALYDMLDDSSTTLTPADKVKSVVTPSIFPNYIRVPETGQASLVTQFEDNLFEYSPLRPLRLSYIRMYDSITNQTDNSTSWWKAEDLCKISGQNDTFPFWTNNNDAGLEHCDSLLVVSFNDRLFTGILALLSAPGIIGLYTTFVVFFARIIRTEPSGKVIYTEIPNVDRVYGLLMDIYMARECGEFELEEKLFAKLLFLYRSPEMIIEYSQREDLPNQVENDLNR